MDSPLVEKKLEWLHGAVRPSSVSLSFVREYCPSVPLSAAFSLVPNLRPRLSLVCPVALSEKPVKA